MTNNNPSSGHDAKNPPTDVQIPGWAFQAVGAAIFKRDSENSLKEPRKPQSATADYRSTPAQIIAEDKRHRTGKATKRSEHSNTSPRRRGWETYINNHINPSGNIKKGGI